MDTTCWTTGTHIVSVEPKSRCEPIIIGAPGVDSVSVNSTPTVTIDYEHDTAGDGTIQIEYEFPHTSSPSPSGTVEVKLRNWIDGNDPCYSRCRGLTLNTDQQSGHTDKECGTESLAARCAEGFGLSYFGAISHSGHVLRYMVC
jgi:hypothetical protein